MKPEPGQSLQLHPQTESLLCLHHTGPSYGPGNQSLARGHRSSVLPTGWSRPGSPCPAAVLAYRCQTLRWASVGKKLMSLSEGLPKGTQPGLWQLFGNENEEEGQNVIVLTSALFSTSRLQMNPGGFFSSGSEERGTASKMQERGHPWGQMSDLRGTGLRSCGLS